MEISNFVKYRVYIPLVLAFGYVPLIIRGTYYERSDLSRLLWFPEGRLFDFFLLYKSYAIILCGAVALILFLLNQDIPMWKERKWTLIVLYAILVLVSGALSEYKKLAFLGSYEMMEGVLVIFSYLVLSYVAFCCVSRDGIEGIRILGIFSLPGICVVLFVALLQIAGLDIFSSYQGQRLITNEDLLAHAGGFSTDSENPVFSTLYNADYCVVYFFMMAAFLFCLGLALKKKSEKTVLFVTSLLCLFSGIKTKTVTGYALLVVFFFFFYFAVIIKSNWKMRLILVLGLFTLLVSLCLGVVFNGFSENIVREIGLSQRIGFFPEAFLNNRGLIWNNTLPTLKDHVAVGSGANTFIGIYPLNEESLLKFGVINVKPHNFYFQQWSDNSLLSLFVLVVFFLWYIIETARFYLRKKTSEKYFYVSFGILLGVVVFLISGLVHDSNVCVSPVFWVLLGAGLGLNKFYTQNKLLF